MTAAVEANEYFRQGLESLRQKDFEEAAEQLRLGLVFAPGQAEGEWLMAVAQAGRGNPGQAIYRLRNGLSLHPALLAESRDVASILGPEKVEELIAAGSAEGAGEKDPSSEQRLVAAWLAADAGRFEEADKILELTQDVSSDAMSVAVAIDAVVVARLRPADAAAVDGGQQSPEQAAPQPRPAQPAPAPRTDAQGTPRDSAMTAATRPLSPDQLPVVANGFVLGLPPQSAMHRSGRIEPNP